MEFEISLNNLLFYAYHGVFAEERRTGNEYRVDLSVFVPCHENISSDELAFTVSYSELFEFINEEMQKPKNLLETVAAEISKKIKETYPIITRGKIRIEKMRPPIPEMLGSASVTLFF